MIADRRRRFNKRYSDAQYGGFLAALERRVGVPVEFRVSETPCFFPASLVDRLDAAARDLIAQVTGDGPVAAAYRQASDEVVPDRFRPARGETLPTFVQVDFGLVRTGPEPDNVEGRLVELQAFPSLYGFQLALAEIARDVWTLDGVAVFPGSLDRDAYLRIVGRAITGGHDPADVVLMEIDPDAQKTRPDFAMTEALWGVRAVNVRQVTRDGRHLVYNRDGRRTRIARVYNRLIPDDVARLGLTLPFDYRDDLDVEWAGGPDWFFRVSKFSLPWLRHPWVPTTMFLDAVESGALQDILAQPDSWLLKPLFSYAGGGIMFGPTREQIAAIPEAERGLYVLQERVAFTPVIDTPHGPTQAEIRMMYVRDGEAYRCVLPLVRMGRGRMMGVDHNRGLRWVGAAAGLIV